MSSFIVGTDHIDLLATAARRIRNGRMPDKFFDYEDTATAQSIGEAMALFNNVAVSEDYQEEKAEPQYIFTPVDEILTGKLEPKHLVQIYLAASCYIYQTGEDHPDWAYRLPWATVKAIQFWAETHLYASGWPIVKLRNSGGYDWAGREDAAWEWTREHGFPDLQINPARLNDDEVREAITATERMGDQVSAALGMSRVGLLGRLVLAAHEDGAYVVLEPDGDRFVRCTVFSESGEEIAEINSPELDTPRVEPTGGDEMRALLAMVDTSPANLAWTEFAPEGVPPLDQGSHAVDLRKASNWSPLTTRPRPSDT
ncbi:hypothetical protein J7I84_19010 [Arthrobacter sp. ISL-85]|uniref:hypothetical protein n=1 Tax=Arthrobacter sp. ISL-85 TaxID=2819115 RepID=UPI001BE7A953|nr:hypothetical protein [Arthrobacter sp. ISL-85]MBT2568547.1 hypothetical protein [Arthrobacter sp. ISL-85]